MHEPVLSDLTDGVLRLTLNDPDTLNALTPAMTRILAERLDHAAKDPDVRVVVLAGSGRAFSSGGNANAFGAVDPGDPLAARWGEDAIWNSTELRTDRLIARARSSVLLHEMPKPTIAMIRGPVAGASLALAAACDFRIVSQTAVFTTAFARLGTSGDFGGSYFLTKLLGPTKTREMYFLSDKISAAEALELGLATKLVADEELEGTTTDFAMRLAKAAPLALRYMKQNLLAAEAHNLETVLAIEARNMVRTFQTEDFREGVAAFQGKRPPMFGGR